MLGKEAEAETGNLKSVYDKSCESTTLLSHGFYRPIMRCIQSDSAIFVLEEGKYCIASEGQSLTYLRF